MDDPVFKMKPVGRVGPYRVGPEYRMQIEERGKRLARAARPKKLVRAEARQLRLPLWERKKVDSGSDTEKQTKETERCQET